VFLAIFGCGAHFKSELRRIYLFLQIDSDNLHTKFVA